jgi:hypothetical protein
MADSIGPGPLASAIGDGSDHKHHLRAVSSQAPSSNHSKHGKTESCEGEVGFLRVALTEVGRTGELSTPTHRIQAQAGVGTEAQPHPRPRVGPSYHCFLFFFFLGGVIPASWASDFGRLSVWGFLGLDAVLGYEALTRAPRSGARSEIPKSWSNPPCCLVLLEHADSERPNSRDCVSAFLRFRRQIADFTDRTETEWSLSNPPRDMASKSSRI